MSDQMFGQDMPIGFSMALAKDLKAMNYFSSQNETVQKRMIERASAISSKHEMEEYVSSLSGENHFY